MPSDCQAGRDLLDRFGKNLCGLRDKSKKRRFSPKTEIPYVSTYGLRVTGSLTNSDPVFSCGAREGDQAPIQEHP
jgi:hypothetical protein